MPHTPHHSIVLVIIMAGYLMLVIDISIVLTGLPRIQAVQGFGAAVLAPSTLALIATHFEEGHERNRTLAWYAAAAGIGATLGLVLGGLLADLITWRAGFFINLPIGALLIAGALRSTRRAWRGTPAPRWRSRRYCCSRHLSWRRAPSVSTVRRQMSINGVAAGLRNSG